MHARMDSSKKTTEQQMSRLLRNAGERFDGVEIDGHRVAPDQVIEILAPVLTDDRRDRIDTVISGRTYQVCTVVEGLANVGNVSAVMRTAEGLGFQPFHVISGEARLKYSKRTTQGAHKWLDVWSWDDPASCCEHLRRTGYRIVVTHLDHAAVPVDEIDFTRPVAVVLGNELNGVTETMLSEADATCVIPSPGFVQSYNISVAAAMTLYRAYAQRVERLGASGDLSEEDRLRLRADFYMRSVRNAEGVLRRALRAE